jgi:hypothetical protein
MNREKQDVDKVRGSYENELSKMRSEQMRLMEKLALAEAKLVSTEKEVELAKTQIQDKERQMAELKEQLAKSKTELALQLNLFKREHDEKEALLKKCEMLEEVVRKNMDEINQMRARESANNNNDRGSMNSARVNASLYENDESVRKIEKENKKLQSDVKDLADKLQRTESQLESMKNLTKRSSSSLNAQHYQNEDEGQFIPTYQHSPPRSPRKSMNNDNDKLKVSVNSILIH